MLILIVSILVLGVVCALLGFLAKGGKEQPVDAEPTCATCTGENTKCEQECMMEAAIKDIEYYDDEQLDKFQGRQSDSYDDDEIEEFAYVLYTLKEEDVAGWNRSLILRNINIPNQLKDDLIALLSQASVIIAFVFVVKFFHVKSPFFFHSLFETAFILTQQSAFVNTFTILYAFQL